MEFGTQKGFSVVLPDQGQQLLQEGELMRRAKAVAENKAKLFADDLQYTNVINPFDNKRIKDYSRGVIMKLANFVSQNPNYKTDPYGMAQYTQYIHELKDNPELNRGLASQDSIKKMNEFAANPKNTAIINSPFWQNTMKEAENYMRYGNQYANNPDEAKKLGIKPFDFRNPGEYIDAPGYLRKIGSELGTSDNLTDVPGYTGSVRTQVDETKLIEAAANALRGPDSPSIQFHWDNLDPAVKSYYGDAVNKNGNILNWVKHGIQAGIKDQLKVGDKIKEPTDGNGNGSGKGTKNPAWSPYTHQVLTAKPWDVHNSAFMGALSPLDNEDTRGNGTLQINEPLKILGTMPTKDGKQQRFWREIKGFENKPLTAYRTNDYMVDAFGRVMTRVNVKVNLDDQNASEVRKYAEDLNPLDSWNPFSPTKSGDEFVTKDSAKSFLHIIQDENGNNTREALVSTWVPARDSYANQEAYNNMAQGQASSNESYPGMINAQNQNPNEFRRKTEDGKIAIFDSNKKFLRYE